jgi:hypothetical protein
MSLFLKIDQPCLPDQQTGFMVQFPEEGAFFSLAQRE